MRLPKYILSVIDNFCGDMDVRRIILCPSKLKCLPNLKLKISFNTYYYGNSVHYVVHLPSYSIGVSSSSFYVTHWHWSINGYIKRKDEYELNTIENKWKKKKTVTFL